MIQKDDLVTTLHSLLKPAGFKKKGLSWYLNGAGTIVVLNLQRSDWGKFYYINIGIWLKALGEELFPKYYRCHMVWRLEELFPNDETLIVTVCDLEKSDLNQLGNLSVFFENKLNSFLLECGDEAKLKIKVLANKKMLRRIEAQYYFLDVAQVG